MIPLSFRRGHERWTELASAYLDSELSPRDLARFERHLPGCERCQQALDDARVAKSLLAATPAMHAPRSFRVTPEMIARPAPVRPESYGRPVALRLAQAATAVAVVAFATILTVDLTGGGSSGGGGNKLSMSQEVASSVTPSVRTGAGGSTSATTSTATATPTPVASVPASTPTTVPTSPPSIVVPTTGDVDAQGFSPSPSPTPTATVTPSPTSAATSPPSVQPIAPGAVASPSATANDSSAQPGTKNGTFAANEDFASHPSEASTTGWYRPAEISLGAAAVVAALAAGVLAMRRRRS